jgi:acyl-CoA thioesterase FadM
VQKLQQWAGKNPGVPAVVSNSVAEAMQSTTLNQTVTMDLEFKRRLPREGQRWIFTRAATKMLRDGRMDLDVTMCNEQMELLCTTHQVIVVLEAQRKFHGNKGKSAL